jgi:hypothetical protein
VGANRGMALNLSFPTQLESSHRKLRMLIDKLFHTVKSGHGVVSCSSIRSFRRILYQLQSFKER